MKGNRTGEQSPIGLSFAALGVVFGDIGTSPLYVLKAAFSLDSIPFNEASIFGVLSLMIWLLIVVVSLKYVLLVLRADNHGEGGILALTTLIRRYLVNRGRLAAVLSLAGAFGAALFFGDSVITPAISVLSAVEGLEVAFPQMPDITVILALILLTALFAIQRFGTVRVAKLFAPIMCTWFLMLALLGIPEIIQVPRIVTAISPHYAIAFVVEHPYVAFVALGAVVLALTGAEALYADISHFGRIPIQRAWFFFVFPALLLNYLGQGALLLREPEFVVNPFFNLGPMWLTVPMVVVASMATLIASQAVISGAFSVARGAGRLGFLPHLRVVFTSDSEAGHIYLPAVNLLLYIAVATVVVIFRDSETLSEAYGLAVTTDFLLTSTVLVLLTHVGWRWRTWQSIVLALILVLIEGPLWLANVTKFLHGGWLPIVIAVIVLAVMMTWKTGEDDVFERRLELEGSLKDFLARCAQTGVTVLDTVGVYFHSMTTTTPFPLRIHGEINRAVPQTIVIVHIKTLVIPYTSPATRLTVTEMDNPIAKVFHVRLDYGFMDTRDPLCDITNSDTLSGLVAHARQGKHHLPNYAYFLSHLVIDEKPGSFSLRKKVFAFLSRFSVSPRWIRTLPADKTVELNYRLYI